MKKEENENKIVGDENECIGVEESKREEERRKDKRGKKKERREKRMKKKGEGKGRMSLFLCQRMNTENEEKKEKRREKRERKVDLVLVISFYCCYFFCFLCCLFVCCQGRAKKRTGEGRQGTVHSELRGPWFKREEKGKKSALKDAARSFGLS